TVLVIDDSASMRRVIKDIINNIDDFEVVDTASDAYDAREKIKQHEPDIVTIDLNMPKMDGAVFLRNLMKLHPMPAVVISSESASKSDIFDDGAVGFIEKPKLGETMKSFGDRVQDTLMKLTFLLQRYSLKKPKAQSKIELTTKRTEHFAEIERKIHPDEILASHPATFSNQKVIGIGSSTGGVESLLKVFQALPTGLPPIIMTQHIPYGFSSSFAQRLNTYSEVEVCEATSGMILRKGCAYLAPGNMHLTLEKRGNDYVTKLLDTAKVSRHKPSVDIMFRSLNNTVGGGAMAIMMTGMGDDGTIGMKELFINGAYTVAQDEKSCVVFGMPKQAIEAGAVKDICSLDDIARYIVEFSNGKRK
ncbi:MAG: chemotaxis-specific protein-glutamate methyltransferase CheB, partial [Arcobacter sp.]|nr:chemotaxis-specific protein-glutamate methyltransferase CheB [Arcobacter sp.]